MSTHDVVNQSPPLEDYNLFTSDRDLMSAVEAEVGHSRHPALAEFGRQAGSGQMFEWGRLANDHTPRLRTHDRFGHRSDIVEFHPAWHELLRFSVTNGLHSLPFEDGAGTRVARDAMFSMISQVEAGHGCPVSMTTSAVPALSMEPRLLAEWEPGILSRVYDPTFAPARSKQGLLMGMGMTEKQGGSDVRANTTRAELVDVEEAAYRVTGHKWFMSAPMCDAFLILAQAPQGLTCFLLPRFTPDGEINPIHLQRLKDKLGNRSNASSEVEFHDALACRVGDEGRGVATIIEMVNHTRLDCVVGSVGLMRQAVAQAAWHAAHRTAFGSRLVDLPLMQNVLADLHLDVVAATHLMTRLSAVFERSRDSEADREFRRLATPVAKFWVTKRCSGVVREALECLGGNGYVEESILPRLYRESPVNAIWEGSGNVIALDVLRAIQREPGLLERFLTTIDDGTRLGTFLDAVRSLPTSAAGARALTERLAVLWAASLLERRSESQIAEAFVESRLGDDRGGCYGTLSPAAPIAAIAERAIPDVE